jgi:probable rRNA maturation factor
MRGVDEATDVLTFPSDPAWPGMVGQIAISLDFAERGAKARGVTLTEETAFLALHGALHLAGWDDESEEERDAMVAEMNRIALLAGLKPDENWSSQPHTEGEDSAS